jgi:hypothetical protein
MAYIRRWVGVVILALAVPVLLSACGSQEVKLDTPINTPVLSTSLSTSTDVLTVFQQQNFSLTGLGELPVQIDPEDQHTLRLIKFVASRFNKPESLISKIVYAAQKYARPDFPRTEDLLAIIAVESTFNTNAHHRGSWGLMQIEAKSHRDKTRGEALTNIDTNIRVGSDVLVEYYSMTGSSSKAIMAYNVGIGSFLKGRKPREYLTKVNREREALRHV